MSASGTAGPEDFRRMVLWEKSQEFAALVAELVVSLPRDRAADVIGGQLVRAAGSVPANIAEGYGRYSQAAYRNHLSIARGSLFEAQSWVDLLHRRGYVSDEKLQSLQSRCHEIGKLLTARMKSLGEGKTYAVREEGDAYEA